MQMAVSFGRRTSICLGASFFLLQCIGAAVAAEEKGCDESVDVEVQLLQTQVKLHQRARAQYPAQSQEFYNAILESSQENAIAALWAFGLVVLILGVIVCFQMRDSSRRKHLHLEPTEVVAGQFEQKPFDRLSPEEAAELPVGFFGRSLAKYSRVQQKRSTKVTFVKPSKQACVIAAGVLATIVLVAGLMCFSDTGKAAQSSSDQLSHHGKEADAHHSMGEGQGRRGMGLVLLGLAVIGIVFWGKQKYEDIDDESEQNNAFTITVSPVGSFVCAVLFVLLIAFVFYSALSLRVVEKPIDTHPHSAAVPHMDVKTAVPHVAQVDVPRVEQPDVPRVSQMDVTPISETMPAMLIQEGKGYVHRVHHTVPETVAVSGDYVERVAEHEAHLERRVAALEANLNKDMHSKAEDGLSAYEKQRLEYVKKMTDLIYSANFTAS